MPDILLPNGKHLHYDHPVSVHQAAADIGAGLAQAALAGKIDGKLVDMGYKIEQRHRA